MRAAKAQSQPLQALFDRYGAVAPRALKCLCRPVALELSNALTVFSLDLVGVCASYVGRFAVATAGAQPKPLLAFVSERDEPFGGVNATAVSPWSNIWVVANDQLEVFNNDDKFLFRAAEEPWNFFVTGIAFDTNGDVLAAECDRNCITVCGFDGHRVRSFGTFGKGEGQFNGPFGICVDGNGLIVVSEFRNHRVQILRRDGAFVRMFELQHPCGVALTSSGDVVVADPDNHRIQVFKLNGEFLRSFGMRSERSAPGQLTKPQMLAIDIADNIIVCDRENHRVQVFTSNGGLVTTFGTEGFEAARFFHPICACVDGDSRIWVGDMKQVQAFAFDYMYAE